MLNGLRVKALRARQNISVQELAEVTGLARDTLYKLEAGLRPNATAGTVALLARTLNTTADYLLDLSPNYLRPDAPPPPPVDPDLLPLLQQWDQLPPERREQFLAIAGQLLASWLDAPEP